MLAPITPVPIHPMRAVAGEILSIAAVETGGTAAIAVWLAHY